MGYFWGWGRFQKLFLGLFISTKEFLYFEFCSISALSCSFELLCWVGGGGGVPSDYFVSTQLQLWLFYCCCCGCCWAVTIRLIQNDFGCADALTICIFVGTP